MVATLACTQEGLDGRDTMSALGQKQTHAPQQAMSALPPIATVKADMPQMVMSALPPKADMCGANRHVCFGPEADILRPLRPRDASHSRFRHSRDRTQIACFSAVRNGASI